MSAVLKEPETHMNLDESMVKTINRAVMETFSSFMGFTPVLKHSEKCEKPFNDGYEISGLIAFIQDSIEGTLALRFRQDSILKLLGRVYGEELSVVDNRIIGGVAELANVIHGIAKEELNTQGHHYQMCLPVVIIGNNHSVVTALSGQKLILTYDLDGEEAVLELVLHKQ
jgi:CheY-specific phosphatase CheX